MYPPLFGDSAQRRGPGPGEAARASLWPADRRGGWEGGAVGGLVVWLPWGGGGLGGAGQGAGRGAPPAGNSLPAGVQVAGGGAPSAARPPNPFPLGPEAGPWLICAAHYSGPDAPEL